MLVALPLATLALLLQPHARRCHHQEVQPNVVGARSGVIACGVVYELCVQRLGTTEAEAVKAEAKMLRRSTLNSLGRKEVEQKMDALQDRLDLSEAELKKIALLLPQVLQ